MENFITGSKYQFIFSVPFIGLYFSCYWDLNTRPWNSGSVYTLYELRCTVNCVFSYKFKLLFDYHLLVKQNVWCYERIYDCLSRYCYTDAVLT